MPYSKYLGYRKIVEQRVKEEIRANYIYAAFIGWQMGAGGKKNFPQYLQYLKITGESKKMTVKERKVLKSKALAYAAGIIAKDKKRKKDK